jgi:hypothetical protein
VFSASAVVSMSAFQQASGRTVLKDCIDSSSSGSGDSSFPIFCIYFNLHDIMLVSLVSS